MSWLRDVYSMSTAFGYLWVIESLAYNTADRYSRYSSQILSAERNLACLLVVTLFYQLFLRCLEETLCLSTSKDRILLNPCISHMLSHTSLMQAQGMQKKTKKTARVMMSASYPGFII